MKKLLLFLFLCVVTAVQAQLKPDSVHSLSPVSIRATRLKDFSIGMKVDHLDSLTLSRYQWASLGELLGTHTSLFLKNYGEGSLTTVSFRGTSASHTGVLWNGFSINSPNIDQTDLSLIPVYFFNSVEILHGGASSLFGSGNIGGSIHLKNDAEFIKKLNVTASATAGSFGNYSSSFRVLVSNEKWQSISGFQYNSFENKFTYHGFHGEKLTQTNAGLIQYGYIQELNRKISDSQLLRASFWYHYSDRNLPPSMTSTVHTQYQLDKSLRTSLQWEKTLAHGILRARTAFIDQNLHYVDAYEEYLSGIESNIRTKSSITEIEAKRYFGENLKISSGGNFEYTVADIKAYNGERRQNRGSVFVSVVRTFPKINWTANFNLRQDVIEDYHVPLAPALGMEGKIAGNLYGKINLSRNFRVPTLNDRYWQPGGNPDLKPEKGWSQEAGLVWKLEKNPQKHSSEFSVTVFSSVVDQWIIWLPQSSGIWTPDNIQKVWSRGIEWEGNTHLIAGDFVFNLSENYTYTLSTNQKKTSSLDNSFEKQLIYTPRHNASGELRVDYKRLFIVINQVYTGKRFVTTDNSAFLKGYTLTNLSFGTNLKCKKQLFTLQLNANNIFNKEYQTIQYRPMPGRGFKVSAIWNFGK
jgi:iron complex outermembrane receptor protein